MEGRSATFIPLRLPSWNTHGVSQRMKRGVEEGRDEEVRELLREVAPMNSSFEMRTAMTEVAKKMVRIVVRKKGDEGREERG